MRFVSFSAVLLISLSSSSWLIAQNKIYFKPQIVLVGDKGVQIPILVDTDAKQAGISLSIKFDETKLNVTGLVRSALTEEASWFDGQIKTGRIQWCVVMDLEPPDIDRTIPPGEGQAVGYLVADVLSGDADSTVVEPRDGLNDTGDPAGGWKNILSYNGNVVRPVLEGGEITIEETGDAWKPCDATGDGILDLTDVINFLNYAFVGIVTPPCIGALDCDANGGVDLTDAIISLNYQFSTGVEPGAFPFDCKYFTQNPDGSGEPCPISPGCQ